MPCKEAAGRVITQGIYVSGVAFLVVQGFSFFGQNKPSEVWNYCLGNASTENCVGSVLALPWH